jgi:O-antigen/teichoic acid export membrane protein
MKPGEIVHSVSRGAFWLGVEKAAAIFSGAAYTVLLMRWLGPTKLGILTLAFSFTGLATMVTGNFEMYLERYGAEFEARGLLLTLRRAHLLALGVKTTLGLLASAVLLLVTPELARRLETPELLVLVPILVLTVVFDGLASTGRATLFGLQRFRWVSVLAILFHVTKTVMVGLLWWSRQGLVALAFGFAALSVSLGLAQTAVSLWIMRHAADHEPPEPERAWRGLFHGMFRYCLPLLGGRIAFTSGQNLSKIIVGGLFDTQLLGYFTFAYQTIERFSEFVNSVPSVLLPSLTWLVARGERERLRSVFDQAHRLIQTLALVASLVLFVFAFELTRVLGSRLFLPAIPILQVMAVVPLARTAQQPLTMLFRSLRRPGTEMALAVVKFAAEFGSYFLLVTTLGVIGAAWSNLAGAVVSYVAALVAAARLLPEGAAERARITLKALALFLPLAGLTLLVESRLPVQALVESRLPAQALIRLLFHLALMLPMGVGLFALGLVRRQDLDKLAEVPLQAAWTKLVRNSVLAVLGFFARLAEPRRAS